MPIHPAIWHKPCRLVRTRRRECRDGIEVSVGKNEIAGGSVVEKPSVVLHGCDYAGDVKVFGFLSGDFEIESFEWADLRHESNKEREQASSEARFAVSFAPFFLIVGAREVVAELTGFEVGSFGDDFLAAGDEGDTSHFRNDVGDGAA